MRLIELKAAIKTACDAVEHYPSDQAVIEAAMRALPVVEERKHGHWVQVSDWDKNGQAHFDCSVCGAGDKHGDNAEVPYCWHCGAQMDEVMKK